MLLALILAQAAPPPASPPPPSPPQDIEVIGRHLSRLRLSLDLDGMRLKACRITASSGDAYIDAQACPAVRICLSQGPSTGAALLACTDQRIAMAVREHDGARENDQGS